MREVNEIAESIEREISNRGKSGLNDQQLID